MQKRTSPEGETEDLPSEATRRIRKKFNIYMSQTSASNPFGANYSAATYQQKRIYKYNLMKEYIKLTKKDAFIKEYEQSRYLGTMILGFVGGYFAAMVITTLMTRGRNIKTNTPSSWDPFLYATFMTSGFGYYYLQSQRRYNSNVCQYILNKYLPQAIENGFSDYEISK